METGQVARKAAEAVAGAQALLIGAGAGMGVDSGLPDFRGNQGFWRAYPVYASLKLSFESMANPRWFEQDPNLAWGFYGHRLELYRETQPHAGFRLLQEWASAMPCGGFVYTSNVDGQFQRAGFPAERVVEIHGAIDWLQCTGDCGIGLFPADSYRVKVDLETMRAQPPLPECPNCGALARPNILMFWDYAWDDRRSMEQQARMYEWLDEVREGHNNLVVVECGAGTAIPSVRHFCEKAATLPGATLIRINPRESEAPQGQLSLPLGALAALEMIDKELELIQR